MVVALLETFNLTVRSNGIDKALHVLLKAVEKQFVKQWKVKVFCDEQKTEQSLHTKLSHSAG